MCTHNDQSVCQITFSSDKKHLHVSAFSVLYQNDLTCFSAYREDLSKQVNSLSTPNKEHQQDPKGNTKVSLMPQRRSFGSGCSWRDSTPLSKHTTDEGHKGEERTSDVPWSVAGQQGTHPPKVIDHVPFRSRGGRDWKSNKGSNWKDKEVIKMIINGHGLV